MALVLFGLSNVILIICIVSGIILAYRGQTSLIYRVLIINIIVTFFLTIFQILAWQPAILSPVLKWFFDLDADRNAPAVFAAVQWVLIGLVCLMLGISTSRLQRIYWWAMALVFAFVAIDDFYAIHELIVYQWRTPYLIAMFVLGFINLLAFLAWHRFDLLQHRTTFLVLILAGIIIAISGFVIEEFVYDLQGKPDIGVYFQPQSITRIIDEIYELFGSSILLVGVFLFAQPRLSTQQWHNLRRLAVLSAVLVSISFLGFIYPLPELELRLLANRTDIQFGEEQELTLVGYWIPDPVIEPGERIHVYLYWRANQTLPKNVSLSSHLLAYPDFTDIAQADRFQVSQIPSEGMPVGAIIRKAIHFDVPENIDTSTTYAISAVVWIWYSNTDEPSNFPVSGEANLLDSETVLIAALPAYLPSGESPQTLSQIDYKFDDAIKLSGFNLPQTAVAGDDYEIDFKWQVENKVSRQLTQFIHLLPIDDGQYYVFDRLPYDGRFVTNTWLAGMSLYDSMSIKLPEDIASGSYVVKTGFYDSTRQIRVPTMDAQNQAVTDNLIILGEIEVE